MKPETGNWKLGLRMTGCRGLNETGNWKLGLPVSSFLFPVSALFGWNPKLENGN
jgi:hypothetical protein